MQGTTIKLAGFIALSMVTHGLLLFINKQHEIQPDHTTIGNQILSISLAVNHQTAPDKAAPTMPEKNWREQIYDTEATSIETGTQEVNKTHHLVKPASVAASVTFDNKTDNVEKSELPHDLHTKATIQSASSSPNETQQSAQRNYVLGEIHNRISQHMNYPDRARRRGWEGSVMIGFNVDKRGFLRNIHLTQTSGYSLLDNAALSAVKKVTYIPVNQWGSIFQPVSLQLPVTYRLTNS